MPEAEGEPSALTSRDKAAAGLTATFIAAATVGGFCVNAAAGFYSLAVTAFVVALLLGWQSR